MTSILPRPTPGEDVEAGVHALHDLIPGMTDEYLHTLAEAVLTAAHPHTPCPQVSLFHGDSCRFTVEDGHTAHEDRQGRSWVVGADVLNRQRKYGWA